MEPNEPISLTKAEIKVLEALIELEQEKRSGVAPTVTVFDSPDSLAFWAKAGAWAWKNKYKLLAAAQAVTEALGDVFTAKAVARDVSPEMQTLLQDDDATLDQLLAARDQIYRALEAQERTPSEDDGRPTGGSSR